ncbi:MAG: hypothetical protein ETSY1_33065 [Candidatus Entotheonella factor]|uniref:DUF1223 domain-containing protein n=1 Tax=Entotheonella factor TaxID=1429438 RepID=W4L9U7_ENTF1|nr:MAG: hypothetical protein ETSY1_33065 [Candidatus Entotheonella factor]
MQDRGFRPDRVIPLAFHVDYWDYLGWPDRFAQAAFTKRQRQIARFNRSRTIYTPQLVLQGQDFRRHSRFQALVEQINQTPARAHIALRVTPTSDALNIVADANVTEAVLKKDAKVFIAVYENNLQSDVKAGENTGRTLRHQFVVRKWIGPLALNAQGQLHWSQSIALAKDWKTQDVGVAACVLNHRNGDTLQAVALSLND